MKNVLIVDDDAGVTLSVARVLRRHGCEVREARSGEACLAALREGYRGVVLMDIMMPQMTGWETIRQILAEGLDRQVIICMLTARATPGDEAVGLESVVFDYLPKPFESEALRRLVDNAAEFLEP